VGKEVVLAVHLGSFADDAVNVADAAAGEGDTAHNNHSSQPTLSST
jgi:hypothetical protein